LKKKITLLSDFNIDNFYNFLLNEEYLKKFKIDKPSYGLFYDKCFKLIQSSQKYHLVIIWTQVEKVFLNFQKLLENKIKNINILYKEVENFVSIIDQISKKTDFLILFSWKKPSYENGFYINDFTNVNGISKNIYKINLLIAEKLKENKKIFFFNIDFILDKSLNIYDSKYWYFTKIPFSQDVFKNAAKEISNIINLIDGNRIKLIITDLDNTLWGNVLGEVGWKKINLGGHNHLGEAYQDFQKKLKIYQKQGIQLAISSKNNQDLVFECFSKNKNMILKKKDFVSWKINWNNKPQNIKEILSELNISEDHAIFFDDNPLERKSVKNSLPGICVPDFNPESVNFTAMLSNVGRLNIFKDITKDDLNRTNYYKKNYLRKKTKKNFLTEQDWLNSLNTKVIFNKVNNENILRTLQLINKTNQMNLRTKRLTEEEINLLKKKNSQLFCCSVHDKFGDMGIVGFLNFEVKKKIGIIKDLVLSCRAFGRDIEKSMIFKANIFFKKKKLTGFEMKYFKTKKNNPCYVFLKENFKNRGNIFYCDNLKKIKPPSHLKIS